MRKKFNIIEFIKRFYLGIVLFFLYLPIITMVVLSFNSSKSRARWGGFSFMWYKEMIEDRYIMGALYNTLIIALISSLIATIIGLIAAIGIYNLKKIPKSIMMSITNIPMVNADIVTGISLMMFFVAFGITLGFKTILLSHITFSIPYVILAILPKFRDMKQNIVDAALDLGATKRQAFFKVVLPEIMPGIVSGFLIAFTMSLDDFIITYFTKGAGMHTISTLVYSQTKRGINPSMYALSTIIFAAVLLMLVISNFVGRANEEI